MIDCLVRIMRSLKDEAPEWRFVDQGPPRFKVYWTFDHHRLYAMRTAGCQRVLVRVKLAYAHGRMQPARALKHRTSALLAKSGLKDLHGHLFPENMST